MYHIFGYFYRVRTLGLSHVQVKETLARHAGVYAGRTPVDTHHDISAIYVVGTPAGEREASQTAVGRRVRVLYTYR